MRVSETDIQNIIDAYSQERQSPEEILDSMFDQQEDLFQYLHSGILDPMPEEDRIFFFFLVTVVLQALSKYQTTGFKYTVKSILDAEEANWALFNDQKGTFTAKLNPFFDQSPEEDLLSFIEDSLAVDEHENLSLASRELIFITLKSIIDTAL